MVGEHQSTFVFSSLVTDKPRDLRPLKNLLCLRTIKNDRGQHSQFLHFFCSILIPMRHKACSPTAINPEASGLDKLPLIYLCDKDLAILPLDL